jgi:hypothetical protein
MTGSGWTVTIGLLTAGIGTALLVEGERALSSGNDIIPAVSKGEARMGAFMLVGGLGIAAWGTVQKSRSR